MTVAVIIAAVFAVELESLLPQGRAEVILDNYKEFMCFGTLGGVVQAECLAFKQHAVVIDQHRAVNEFESAFTVILEIADGIESVRVVALRLDLETQLQGLPLRDFAAVWHYLHRERIGLLHIEVIGTGCKAAHGSDYEGENGNKAE